MSKYLIEARYTPEGLKILARDGGTGRRTAIAQMTEKLGGKLEAFYYALGDVDVYSIVDFPDDQTAAAAGLAVNFAGVATTKTTKLLTPEDVDKATKKAADLRPSGR